MKPIPGGDRRGRFAVGTGRGNLVDSQRRAQMVAGHVALDISCPDRLYLTGFVAKLQAPGGVIYFLHDHLRSATKWRVSGHGVMVWG